MVYLLNIPGFDMLCCVEYAHAHTLTHMHKHTHAHAHACTCTHIHTQTCKLKPHTVTHIHTHTRTRTRTRTHTHMHTLFCIHRCGISERGRQHRHTRAVVVKAMTSSSPSSCLCGCTLVLSTLGGVHQGCNPSSYLQGKWLNTAIIYTR